MRYSIIGVHIYKYNNDNITVWHQTRAPTNGHDNGGGWFFIASYGVRCYIDDGDGCGHDPEKLSNRFTSQTRAQSRSGRWLLQKTHTARAGCRQREGTCAARYTRARSVRDNSSKCTRSTRTDSYGLAVTTAQCAHTVYTNPRTYEHQRTSTARLLLDACAHPANTTTARRRSGTQTRR